MHEYATDCIRLASRPSACVTSGGGKSPDRSPRTSPPTQRGPCREDRGTYAGATLSVVSDGAKIAWMAAPASQPEDLPEGVPTLGPFPERRDWFKKLMTPWLAADCPPITRIGFACHLMQFAETRKACYELLGKYLPSVKLDYDDDWGDFSYRINRRKVSCSGVPGLKINRLSTWDELMYKVTSEQGTAGSESHQGSTKDAYACSATLDINTIPEHRTELPHDLLPGLFGELIDMASEIAAKGDVPNDKGHAVREMSPSPFRGRDGGSPPQMLLCRPSPGSPPPPNQDADNSNSPGPQKRLARRSRYVHRQRLHAEDR